MLWAVILISDSFEEWVKWDSKVHAYPVRRDDVLPFYNSPSYQPERIQLKSCGPIVVYSRALESYIDLNELAAMTPDLRIIERPERFDTNEAYNDWLSFCGMGDVAPHMALASMGSRYTKEAFVRADACCEYKGGYCHIAFSDQTISKMNEGDCFVLYADYDDDVHNIYTPDKAKATEIWDYIYNIPDLNGRDVIELGMG